MTLLPDEMKAIVFVVRVKRTLSTTNLGDLSGPGLSRKKGSNCCEKREFSFNQLWKCREARLQTQISSRYLPK